MKIEKVITWLSLIILLAANLLSPSLAFATEISSGRVKVSYSPNGQVNAGGSLVNDQLATGGSYAVRSIGTGTNDVNFTPTLDNSTKLIFDSWNTKSDGSGDSYTQGQVISSWNYTDEVILYAQWANAATLSYNLNGTTGNTAPDSNFAKVGTSIILPEVPSGLTSAAAHTHVDTVWNTATDGSGTDYNAGDTYTLTANATLYAKIVADDPEQHAKLSFDLSSGTTISSDLTNGVTATNSSLTLPTDIPTRDDYSFSGWKINDTVYQAGDTISLPYSTTAVAQWTKILYTTITFTSPGTVSGMPPTTKVTSDGSNWTVPSDTPTRDGYTFVQWSYVSNGKSLTAMPGDSIKLNTTTTSWTFTAIWNEIKPVLSFNLNGGTSDSTDFTNGITATNGSVTLPTTIPTKTDYTFSGWKINGSTYTAGSTVAVTSSTTAVALWTAINYTTINFKSDGVVSNMPDAIKVVSNGSTIALPTTTPNRVNDVDGSTYTFMYWVDNTTPSNTYSPGDSLTLGTSSKSLTLTAVWAKATPLQYIVSFNSNGSTSGNPTNTSLGVDAGTKITIPGAGTMKKKNFTFIGWSPDSGTTVYQEGDKLTINSNITLSAVWMSETTEGVIKFETQGASGSDPELIKANTGTTVTLPDVSADAVAPAEGYFFWGWAKKSTATYPDYYADEEISMPKGITTLYGVWAKTDYRYWAEVDISMNGAEGTLPTGYKSVNFYKLDSADSTYTFTVPSADNLSIEGYTFGGWKDAKDVIYNAGDTISLTNESVTKLKAVWDRITYKVSYDAADATGGSVPISTTTIVDYKGTYTLLPNSGSLVKTGSTFIGWNVNGTMYAPGQKVVISQDTVITPVWMVNPAGGGGGTSTHQATIIYQSTEADVTGDLPASETVNVDYSTYYTVKDAKANFKREGYTFVGWYTMDNSGNQVTYSAGSSFIVTASMVFYALWEKEVTPIENAYKISYNGNTNTSGLTPSTQYVEEGNTLTLPNQNTLKKVHPIDFNESTGTVDTSKNYLFVGWSTDKNAVVGDSSIIEAGDTVTPTEDTIYYAIWDIELRKVTLSYNGNGNTGGTLPDNQVENRYTDVTVDKNDAGSSLTKVVDGVMYIFAGWNTKADGSGTDYVRGSALALNKDITLYAKWIPTTSSSTTRVIYIGNGNDVGDYVTYDDVSKSTYTILDAGNRKKTGYIFTGWNTKSDGSGTSYAKNDVINTENLSSLILYAQWDLEARDVTLTYDGNGNTGGIVPTNQTEARYTSIMIDSSNQGSTLTKSILNTTTNTYDNYIFNGWNTKADGSGTHYISGATMSLNADTTLYAEWVSTTGNEKMRITYIGNGNDTGSTLTTVDTNESTYTIAEIGDRSKTGYIFTHWNTKADGSGTNYYPGQIIDTNVNASLVLYAQWSPVSSTGITIVYDGNQNTSGSTPASQDATSGESITLAAKGDLKRTGYSFVGWSESINPTSGSIIYAATGSASFKKNTVLYAVWAIDGDYVATAAKINYYANYTTTDTTNPFVVEGYVDASQVVNDETVLSGHKIVANEKNGGAYLGEPIQFVTAATAGFSKTNYIFKGWATKKNSSEVVYKPGESIVLNNSELNLYGVWEVGTYTVAFNSNNGSGTMSDQIFTYDIAQNLTTNSFTRDGYTFTGWNTKTDGSGTNYTDKASVTNIAGSNQSITLYAQWKANNYTVAFNANNGKGTMTDQTFTYDVVQNLTTNSFTRDGYTFTGWNTKFDGSGTSYADRASVTNLITTNNGKVTLYAQWVAGANTITFDANGGITTQQSISGKTDETIYLSTVAVATRIGYTFLGWYNGDTKMPESVTMPSGGIQYTAKWQANTFTVSFHANNGQGTMADQLFTYDISQNLNINKFTRAGYTFTGWNTEKDGSGISYADQEMVSNLVTGVQSYSLSRSFKLLTTNDLSITLYAQWAADDQVITFDANGGTTTQSSIIGKTDETINLSSVAVATRTGYTFLGWYSGDTKMPESVTMPAGGIQYTAKWQANQYTVAFNANTGTNKMANQIFTYDIAQNLTSNNFTKHGYTFVGWNTRADGSGISYTDRASVINLTATNGQMITLYAQWSANEQMITFDANGGTSTQQTIIGKIDTTIDLSTVTVATREGYTFLGWYTDEQTGVAMPDSVIMPDGGIIYYARWKQNDPITTRTLPSTGTSTSSSRSTLPNTGEKTSWSFVIYGLTLISLVILTRNKKQKNDYK